MEKVKVELLQPKVFHRHYRIPKGSLHDAWIDGDGRAQLYKYPSTKLEPFEYRIFVADQEYHDLLSN